MLFWCVIAAFANGIALYAILALFIVLTLQYKQNLFKQEYHLYIFAFFFVAISVFYGAKLVGVAAGGNIADSIRSLIGFFVVDDIKIYVIFAIFFAFYLFYQLRSGKILDFFAIFTVWIAISIISDLILQKGFPHQREMLPVYPLIALMIIEIFENFERRTMKYILVAITLIIIARFIFKIDPYKQSTINVIGEENGVVYSLIDDYISLYKEGGFEYADNKIYEKYDQTNPIAEFYIKQTKKRLSQKDKAQSFLIIKGEK
jgi:hypothetical protein